MLGSEEENIFFYSTVQKRMHHEHFIFINIDFYFIIYSNLLNYEETENLDTVM